VLSAAVCCVAQVPASNHVFFLAEENQSYSSVIGNSNLPYINSLAQQYGLATSYYGNTHPSIGNYFMMTTGQIYTNDDSYMGPLPASVDNIVRRVLTAGKTWKSYAEGLPSAGYTGGNTGSNGDYYKRHNPFSYFSDVANSSTEKMNLVSTDQLATDLTSNQVPNLAFIVPNGMDDAHDGTPKQMDNWLSQWVPKILASQAFQDGGILFITFDESLTSDNAHGGGQIVTIVISPDGKAGYKSTTLYQHQSLLKTMLMALGLSTDLGAAASAPDMGEFFNSTATSQLPVHPPLAQPQLAQRAVTAASASATSTATQTTAGSASFDAYPSSATVLSHLENANWTSCNCGGTGSGPASKALTPNGSAVTAEITGSGSGVSGWLWYYGFGSMNASNWIMDYDVTPTTNLSGAAALEFDGNQTGGLGNFVFGTECNYGYNPSRKTVWRFWTMSGSETWGTTSYACPVTQTNHTYHVQMHFVVSAGQYQVSHVKVTDLTAGSVVEDDTNLGTFKSVGSHGSSIDIQTDVPGGNTLAAQYQNITIVRW
jgi:acid phosphatase